VTHTISIAGLLLGLASAALTIWSGWRLWRALSLGEVSLLPPLGQSAARRSEHPVSFWASVLLAAVVLVTSAMIAGSLLAGAELRWWL
jgi:hypothetical protein